MMVYIQLKGCWIDPCEDTCLSQKDVAKRLQFARLDRYQVLTFLHVAHHVC